MSAMRAIQLELRRQFESQSIRERSPRSAACMDPSLTRMLERAVDGAGFPPHRMVSGAGHDAMILARHMPAAMLFMRSPGGISHDTRESVLAEDVEAALVVGLRFLEELERQNA
jgi:allantoate deiminase